MSAPQDPFSGMAAAAVAIHQLFTELVQAGFDEHQALHLVTATLAQALIAGKPNGEVDHTNAG